MTRFLAGTLMILAATLALQANSQAPSAIAPAQSQDAPRMAQATPPPPPRPTCASCGAQQKADGSISHRSDCAYAPKKKK
jgi:hypothetical protein